MELRPSSAAGRIMTRMKRLGRSATACAKTGSGPLSNQAAAVVVLPVAIQTALQLNLDPRTFAVMIAVAASSGFLTPLEPACVMIYGPGRYKFMDFVKVGALLTLLIYVIAIVLVPLLWNPVL